MHYLIGTEIILTARAPVNESGPQPLNVANVQRTARSEYFEPNVKYTLYNIRPLPDNKFSYAFQRQDGDVKEYVFNSISAAERVIAQARGEDLPDYEAYHRQNP